MPDKTPLELAKEIVGESGIQAHLSLWAHNINTVATALIERMTPVEPIANNDWRLSCHCGSCKGTLYSNGGGRPKFCAKCGVPITWK